MQERGGDESNDIIGGPEYETLALFGSNLLIDELDVIVKSNELCNRFGLDTISTGSVIGFSMEAFERGLITAESAGGIELRWGDGDLVHDLIHRIAHRNGIGKLMTVIEVKTWNGKDKYLHHLWSDIFKLYGYKSSEYKDAGQNKYLLVLYKAETDTSADLITKIDESFIHIQNIKNQMFSEELFRKYLEKADWFDESISQLYTDIKDKLINVPFICFDEKKYLVHDKSNRNYAFLLKLL